MSLKCILQGQNDKSLKLDDSVLKQDNEDVTEKIKEIVKPTAEEIGAAASTHAAQHATGGSDPITPEDIGAAPGGYGGDGETLPFYDLADNTGDLLKAKLIELSNDDTVVKPFKKHFTFTAHYFLGSAWTWFGELLCIQNESGYKRLFLHGYNFAPAIRHIHMTAFENDNHEWEWNGPYWQNPPLVVGQEYKTAELFNNQEVYVKMVNCGAPPTGTSEAKMIEFGKEGTVLPIRCYGTWNYNARSTIPYEYANNDKMFIGALGNKILVRVYGNYGSYTVYAVIYYTKND